MPPSATKSGLFPYWVNPTRGRWCQVDPPPCVHRTTAFGASCRRRACRKPGKNRNPCSPGQPVVDRNPRRRLASWCPLVPSPSSTTGMPAGPCPPLARCARVRRPSKPRSINSWRRRSFQRRLRREMMNPSRQYVSSVTGFCLATNATILASGALFSVQFPSSALIPLMAFNNPVRRRFDKSCRTLGPAGLISLDRTKRLCPLRRLQWRGYGRLFVLIRLRRMILPLVRS